MEMAKLQQAVDMTSHILHSFYCKRNINETIKYFADDVSWIVPGEEEIQASKKDIQKYFEKSQKGIPHSEIVAEKFSVMDCGENCLVYGRFTVHSTEECKMLFEVNQRVSFLYKLCEEKLIVHHLHVSNSYEDMVAEEFFPSPVVSQSYQYLHELLKEKTEVIEMITSNINGGLKSSNDDEIYSNFYVNAGLPDMLGYTYEEFMQKTNNCAVGAVYEQDMPKTLLSVSKQIKNSGMYSVEYRMEKKDGSLIWVLDSGRKSEDGKGGYKINSILMDITPLKTALNELELERSRYRIALENITDVMYEYDIEHDIYTTYQRIEVGGKMELEKYEIAEFSKSFWSKTIVHPSDAEKFLEILRAEQRNMIEIRTKSVQAKGKWRWTQVSCSVIYNASRMPIRTIGTMKDVTDEKNNTDKLMNSTNQDALTKLFNQMTAKQHIQQYLMQKDVSIQSALMVVDLDDFKKVNDIMGSLFGNAILIATSQVLKENIRTEDIIGRISGDEFIILIKRADFAAAALCAKRIMEKISFIGLKEKVEISCSIGIAMTAQTGMDYDTLLRMADRALYFAKATGKNKYVFYEDSLGSGLDIDKI